ncbi:nucleotide pyrophosphatase/phosphodiesterase family protein [Microbacterium sp. NPDC076911]|uniref:alkaline phosphatase family protein n=1 Tax=Microbacterium sp. NPDC076911 TaxID=3154958 RepID=UPI00341C2776
MPLSLPVDPPHARSLTGVVPEMARALAGESDWFSPATSAIVFVIDGLGSHNLAARSGHARFLASMATKKDVVRTVFPSTTASALASLLTGTLPGEHGIVGYKARVPGTQRVANQLRGWETDGLPESWQRAAPLATSLGREFFVVTKSEYESTGYTRATQSGAHFVGVDNLTERVAEAARLAHQHPGSLVYLYAPELDGAGHKHGWQSDEWVGTLETLDAAASFLAAQLRQGVGAVVTADHGMIDVPRHRHILLSAGDDLVEGVSLVGGEPRMLHLYAEASQQERVLARWRASEGERSWVLSRAEVIDSGLLGPVSNEVIDRIGDVLIAPRAGIAYYDDRTSDKGPQRMIGQHGSLTSEERIVPLIRLGAFH